MWYCLRSTRAHQFTSILEKLLPKVLENWSEVDSIRNLACTVDVFIIDYYCADTLPSILLLIMLDRLPSAELDSVPHSQILQVFVVLCEFGGEPSLHLWVSVASLLFCVACVYFSCLTYHLYALFSLCDYFVLLTLITVFILYMI